MQFTHSPIVFIILKARDVLSLHWQLFLSADGKKRQELKELLVPDIIKFLFNRLPRTAILTEFQKLYEQNQDHIWERKKKIPTHHSIGKQDIFYFYVLFTRLPLTHQRGIEMENVYQLKLFAKTAT